jgi:hypothetical protein
VPHWYLKIPAADKQIDFHPSSCFDLFHRRVDFIQGFIIVNKYMHICDEKKGGEESGTPDSVEERETSLK